MKDAGTLEGLLLQVNHTNLGTLFAAVIQGTGVLVTQEDEYGYAIPFMTTDEILRQISKFGFYVTYKRRSHLPGPVLDFFQRWMDMGYGRITRVLLQSENKYGDTIWVDSVVLFKETVENQDLLCYGKKLSRIAYMKKVDANSIQNVTNVGFDWDWVDSFYRLEDIMDENVDYDDEFSSTVNSGVPEARGDEIVDSSIDLTPEGFTVYEGDADESE